MPPCAKKVWVLELHSNSPSSPKEQCQLEQRGGVLELVMPHKVECRQVQVPEASAVAATLRGAIAVGCQNLSEMWYSKVEEEGSGRCWHHNQVQVATCRGVPAPLSDTVH
jgi:hypothetical protein